MYELSIVHQRRVLLGEKKQIRKKKALEAFVTYLSDLWFIWSHLTLAVLKLPHFP